MKHIRTYSIGLGLILVLSNTVSAQASSKPEAVQSSKKNGFTNTAQSEMDLNKDGRIDAEEAKIYREKLTKQAARRAELLAANKPLTMTEAEKDPALKQIFKTLDANKDGKITQNEMKKPEAKKAPLKSTPTTDSKPSKTPVWKKKDQ